MIIWSIKYGSQSRGGTVKIPGPAHNERKQFRTAMRKASRVFFEIS